MNAKKAVPDPPKHAFYEDPTVPPDYKKNRFCRRCKHMGRPGDLRHTDEFPPAPEEDRSEKILGES